MKTLYIFLFAFLGIKALSIAQNVGIGTTAPKSKLHVHENGPDGSIYLTNGTTTDNSLRGGRIRLLNDNLNLINYESTGKINLVPGGGITRLHLNQFGQVGVNTTTPHNSAILDIMSTNKGVRIPTVELDSLTDVTTVPNPALYLMIFNNKDTTYFKPLTFELIKLRKGLHYWDGFQWQRLNTGNEKIWDRNFNRVYFEEANNELVLHDTTTTTNSFFVDYFNIKSSVIRKYKSGVAASFINLDTITYPAVTVKRIDKNVPIDYLHFGYSLVNIANSKRVGGIYSLSDTLDALHAFSLNGTGAQISSNKGIGLRVNTQLGFFGDTSNVNSNTAIDVFSNGTYTNPAMLLKENDDDFSRISFSNNSGNHFWQLAGYNNASQAVDLFAINNNRYGDIMHTTGSGYVKIIGKDILGQSVLLADQGKLSINHTSSTGNTQLNLWENDSTGFCRILMRSLTQSPNHYWNIAATSNTNLSSERFNFYNNRYGNILSLSGNGVVAINRDPVSAANTDAALQIKQIGSRDGIKLEHANSTNNWTWYVNNTTNDLEMYYNGSYKGSFSNASGLYIASDRKLKKNISPISLSLSNVLKLEPVTYSMKSDENNQQVMGFVAQEVEKLFPEIVKEISLRDGTSYKAMNYDAIGVLAIKAIQEQQVIIEDQQKAITLLLEEIQAIKQQLNK